MERDWKSGAWWLAEGRAPDWSGGGRLGPHRGSAGLFSGAQAPLQHPSVKGVASACLPRRTPPSSPGPAVCATGCLGLHEPRMLVSPEPWLSGAGALVLTSGYLPIVALALSGVQLSPVAISQSLLVSVGLRTVWPE